jgi:ASPIC and UnbV/FG-GAP-like repeat/Dockerin type I domain
MNRLTPGRGASCGLLVVCLLGRCAADASAYTWCGDVNCDRAITASDALAVLRSAVSDSTSTACPLSCSATFPERGDLPQASEQESGRHCADFNCDGSVTSADALLLLLHTVDSERRLSCSRSCGAGGPAFTEVTSHSGIVHEGDSWGGAWGDYDGDGWADLWVTNHFEKSRLYRNVGGVRFEDVSETAVVPAPERSDTHATAWADFDNDGDLDLYEQIGAGGGGPTAFHPMPKHLYVNENGVLFERAADHGVDYPSSRGRGVSWIDFDLDGRLDLALLAELRPDHAYPSAMLRQQPDGRFVHVTDELGFDVPLSSKYAHLCDLTGQGTRELIVHGGTFPQRIYRIGTEPLLEMRAALKFPTTGSVEDSAAGDFDGDLDIDFFLVRNLATSEVVWSRGPVVRAFLFPYLTTEEQGFVVHTYGDITVHLEASLPVDPSLVHVGSDGHHPTGQEFTLQKNDPANQGLLPHEPGGVHGVLIGRDGNLPGWTVLVAVPPSEAQQRLFNVEVVADATVSAVDTINIDTRAVPPSNRLLVNDGSRFVDATSRAGLDFPTYCHSVTSADFDNDMDLDLYLVCTRRVQNLPNMFLENQGDGTFVVIPDAAGAQGSAHGLGDVALAADYNRDGFVDLFLTNGTPLKPFNADGPDQLFLNAGNANHWLELDLVGVRSNRDAIGSTVLLKTGRTTQLRQTGCTAHKWSFDDRRVHFGLGPNSVADSIEIRWPSGTVQTLKNVPADQVLTVTEPAA